MLYAKQSPERRLHLDPITGEPGAHPVGTGIGAAVGGVALGAAGIAVATGTAIGMAAGPLGAAVGAVAGSIAGGILGHRLAERMHPSVAGPVEIDAGPHYEELESSWRKQFAEHQYPGEFRTFEDYLPAYRYGYESRARYPGVRFEEIEPDLEWRWEVVRGSSPLTWEEARVAVRDAWEHRSQKPFDIPEMEEPFNPWLPPL
jgi:hypothetical protein